MANLFSLSRKAFVMCYCFREPIKTFFLDACQMIVKSRVSGLPNWKKPYNKHPISLVFSVHPVNYGSSFFSIDLWPKREQYGPKTQQIRGIYLLRNHRHFALPKWKTDRFKNTFILSSSLKFN